MNIQKKIKEKGFTIAQVAAKLPNRRGNCIGMSQGSLSSILNGNPSINILKDVADIIGVTLPELVADDTASGTLFCPHCGKPIEIDIKASV